MCFFLILSLPPTQQPRQSPPEDQAKEEVPKNRCKRFLGCCVKALTCASCTALSSQCCRKEEGCCQNLKNKLSRRSRLVLNAKHLSLDWSAWFGIETRWGLTSKTKMESRNEGFGRSSTVARRKKWATRAAVSRWGKVGLRSAIKGILHNLKRKKGLFCSLSLPNTLQCIFYRPKCCSRAGCKRFWGAIFCCHCCRKKPELPPSASTRKESLVSNKKKSLTPLSVPPPKVSYKSSNQNFTKFNR